MTLKTIGLLTIAGTMMTGCVTMETAPLPDTFKGTASLIDVPNSTTLKAGPVEIDEYFAEMQIKIGRSARLENDIHMKSGLISKGAKMAEAGDSFLALPFYGPGRSETSRFSWCKAGKAGVSGFENFFTGAATPICVFWANAVPRIAIGGSGSRIFPQGGTYDPNVWINVPEFTETGESDIGPLTLEVKIDTVSGKGKMRVETMFRDPEGKRSILLSQNYQPEEDGSYNIRVFNGRVRVRDISQEDEDELFSIEVLEPLANGLSTL